MIESIIIVFLYGVLIFTPFLILTVMTLYVVCRYIRGVNTEAEEGSNVFVEQWNQALRDNHDETTLYVVTVPQSCSYVDYETQKEEHMCMICIQQTHRNAIRTKCNHVFCDICLDTWLKQNKNCPYCRNEIA